MKKLIIVADIDNDLGKKAGIPGPIIGKDNVENAAIAMGYTDPEDSDLNAIFSALKLYEELKHEEDLEIVLLTGDEDLGEKAFLNISKGLDFVINQTKATSCIFVSDGKSDEQILEIIRSRLRVDAIKRVNVKQAKVLESTYFVLLEKLRDPYFSKLIIALPGIILALLSIVFMFNIKIQYVGFLFGLYLILRGYNLDKEIFRLIEILKISEDKFTNLISTFFFSILLIIGFFVSYKAFLKSYELGLEPIAKFVYGFDPLITIIIGMSLIILIYKILKAYLSNSTFNTINEIIVLINMISAYIIYKLGYQWIVNLYEPYISFSQFIFYSFITLALNMIINSYLTTLKRELIVNTRMIDFDVYSMNNNYIGKVASIDLKNKQLSIATPYKTSISIPISEIDAIKNKKIIIRD